MRMRFGAGESTAMHARNIVLLIWFSLLPLLKAFAGGLAHRIGPRHEDTMQLLEGMF